MITFYNILQIVGNCLQLNIAYKYVVLGYSSKLNKMLMLIA